MEIRSLCPEPSRQRTIKNLLKKNGVKIISARGNIFEGSEGIILEAMLEGYAEYYSAELSEKVIRGLTDNAPQESFFGHMKDEIGSAIA